MTTQLKILNSQKCVTTNSNLEKLNISDMHHRISYKYINFQENIRFNKVYTQIYLQKIASCLSQKPCTQIYLQNSSKLLQFATTILVTF